MHFSKTNLSRVEPVKDPYRKVDAEIDRVNNGKLKAMPVSLARVGGSLYIQGTFPPKPGEQSPKQRRIPLKLKANVDFLYAAQQRAIQIGSDLMLGKWQWTEPRPKLLLITAADFVELHRQNYLSRNGKPETQIDTLKYWETDFLSPFNKLDRDKPLSLISCRRQIEKVPNNTRSRTRIVKAYRQLLELAGIDGSSLNALKGKYRATAVQPRDIPTVEQIIEWGNKVPTPWKFHYFLLASFGIRGTEAHPRNCQLDDLDRQEIIVYAGKTEQWRYVPSCNDRIFTELRCEPNWARPNRSPHQASNEFSKILKSIDCPFTPYALRHHYAYYTLLDGWDTTWSAKCMGHSVDIHQRVYWLCIDREMGRKIKQRQSRASLESSVDQIRDNQPRSFGDRH